jgi:hypothetical protein
MTEYEPGQGDILGSLAANGLPLSCQLMGPMDQFTDLLQSTCAGTPGLPPGYGW